MRSKIGLFATVLLLTAVMAAQEKPAASRPAPKTQEKNAQQAIARLKATPVADMESGLPDEPFGKWFAAQVKPAAPRYEAKECDASSSEKAAGLKCVTASAKVGGMKRLELSFAVPPTTSTAPSPAPKNIRETQYKCRFLVGSLGPGNPQMKFPTRVVRKLSDLAPMLQP